MCGIVGILNLDSAGPPDLDVLRSMLGMIRHRGPDEFGVFRDAGVGLGSARLSIIDLAGGSQPICNEDGRYWIVFNGEIFNYLELRSVLEARGHHFKTQTDTEVIVHLYEDHGPQCVQHLNGQFAFAIWDTLERRLFLARDRLGIRPLFYAVSDGRLVFGSEIKALLACPGVRAELDSESVAQVFTFWSTLAPRTAFRNILEIPPAHSLVASGGTWKLDRYWALDFASGNAARGDVRKQEEELEALLVDAARIRLRADVPVGAYLSGGLDSSLTTAMVRRHFENHLETFSIAFENPEFDESGFQVKMADHLGTEHRVIRCGHADIGRVFPEVVWHTETPILRTAPAPLFLLSGLVREHGLKVVLTGEGADEFLGGYDIFKAMKIRRFWAREPESRWRSLLLRRLYPDIGNLSRNSTAFLAAFFRRNLEQTDSPFYSHLIRWNNAVRARRVLKENRAFEEAFGDAVSLPREFAGWSHLGQAQFLEISIFLSEYLLCSQGDRMAMAHSVEGRYPFLDHRVVEFANQLPSQVKIRGLTEKWLLKQIGQRYLPGEICRRPKRPYRAPVHRSFFPDSPEYLDELLGAESLDDAGMFKADAVAHLIRKARSESGLSEIEDMALAGVISTQLVHRLFVRDFRRSSLPEGARITLVDQAGKPAGS